MQTIAFIGFGEAATAFTEGWGASRNQGVRAFDIKTDDPMESVAHAKRTDYLRAGISGCATMKEALKGATVIFSTVTADQAGKAAREAAKHLGAGALYCDMNSCAPSSKREAAKAIEARGGRYVDVAVMSPVLPLRHHAPLLVSGPHAAEALTVLQAMDMRPALAEGPVGTASAIKMIRSIMVKGIEALVLECVLSATREGVDKIVLSSLEETFPGFGWPERVAYMLERAMVHGTRRAAEMEEAAKTAADLGLSGRMAQATAEWEGIIGALQLGDLSDDEKADYRLLAQKILTRLD
ncbi:3-hydroxyisobutyrate dehydrogenase [Nitratireductor aquibiodomus]|uniref:3-hydroxyisobutyrate dehydrogenase n=1 Tax=Nitratireductor aquibiodomus TaxID=204799 RepID=A0A1H4L306_9HYPH|nr:DUF1932 domain-containing protein [Nitratireductor aquibiodomus]SEB64778.1 3-hydroxyisobutyrate dehydrogenase [Nitratireductor aquibiodomus]